MDGSRASGDVPDTDPLYDDAPCGLLVTDPDGLIERVNRTFCSWVGRDAAELIGRIKVQALFTMGGRIFHQTHWTPLLQIQGSVAEVKLEVLHRDGRRFPMVWNAVRRTRGERTVHELAVFMAQDRHRYEQELLSARQRAEELFTRERAAREALQEAQAERDRQQALAQDRALFAEQMMAIVSHDLRNPLSVIRMSAHLIAKGELSSNQQRALLRLNSSGARATRLIADLLDFSQARIGAGLQVTLAVDDLHGLVADAVEDLQVAFPKHRLVHLQSGSGACLVSADRVIQMIGNLVANAANYGDANGSIVLTSEVLDDHFCIAVHNHGPPIPGELLPTLFDSLTRGQHAEGDSHSLGLGLFIVREIAKAHGGGVQVDSTAEAGTTFTVSFPRGTPGS